MPGRTNFAGTFPSTKGRALIAESIGPPAEATNTHDELAGHIDDARQLASYNLAAHKLPIVGNESLLRLAEMIGEIAKVDLTEIISLVGNLLPDATFDDIVEELDISKAALIANLISKGVIAQDGDSFRLLAAKVMDIVSGLVPKAGDIRIVSKTTPGGPLHIKTTYPALVGNTTVTILTSGEYRTFITPQARGTIAGNVVYSQVYLNGSPKGVARSVVQGQPRPTVAEDFVLKAQDILTVYAWSSQLESAGAGELYQWDIGVKESPAFTS